MSTDTKTEDDSSSGVTPDKLATVGLAIVATVPVIELEQRVLARLWEWFAPDQEGPSRAQISAYRTVMTLLVVAAPIKPANSRSRRYPSAETVVRRTLLRASLSLVVLGGGASVKKLRELRQQTR